MEHRKKWSESSLDLVNYYKSQYSIKIKGKNHPLIKVERLQKKVVIIKIEVKEKWIIYLVP